MNSNNGGHISEYDEIEFQYDVKKKLFRLKIGIFLFEFSDLTTKQLLSFLEKNVEK